MSVTSTSDEPRSEQTDARAQQTEGRPGQQSGWSWMCGWPSMRAGRSMSSMMLLCLLGMIAAVIAWGVWGVNVAGLFCVVMMAAMIWMMAGPALSRTRRHDHDNH